MNNEEMEKSNSILTYTGRLIDIFNPKPEMIDIVDIAQALSNKTRWGGHIDHLYTVAEHSVWCALKAVERNLSNELVICALLHDASEAYMGDMPTPFKKRMPEYMDIEDLLMSAIAIKYRFPWPMPKEVKEIDREALNKEWDLMIINGFIQKPIVLADIKSDFISIYKQYSKQSNVLTKRDLIELFEGFLLEVGKWHEFKDYIGERGYTAEDLGLNNESFIP